jgi:serine/threonine protein kinase
LKILDFGLAVLRDLGNANEVGKSQLIGTVEYMSPEQLMGKALDGRVMAQPYHVAHYDFRLVPSAA